MSKERLGSAAPPACSRRTGSGLIVVAIFIALYGMAEIAGLVRLGFLKERK